MANSKKTRLSVPLSNDLLEKIQNDAEKLGVSPATYASVIIGNHYKTLDISMQTVQQALTDMFGPLLEKHGLGTNVVGEVLSKTNEEYPKFLSKNVEDENE